MTGAGPMALLVVALAGVPVAVAMAVSGHRRDACDGVASDRGREDAGRHFLPATAGDEDAARRLGLIRPLDRACDRPTYAPGDAPLRLRGGDCRLTGGDAWLA